MLQNPPPKRMKMTDRSITPPPIQRGSQIPTAKERKYDRQLRLWAASGQEALENARVLLLNSGPGVIGIETLKNLILPGVGSFTIVDEGMVEEKDLGVNFFLTEASLGKSRAEESCRLLRELNPEVEGLSIPETVAEFLSNAQNLDSYSLVILVGSSKHVQMVSEFTWRRSIPLFYVHSIGFYGHLSVQLPHQFPIVDTHPDPASTQDLRLLNPWPALMNHMTEQTKDLQTMSDHDHGHVPYLLLLLHYIEAWRGSHDGKAPANYDEKQEFKALMQKGARTSNPEGGEENFDEAAAAVLKSLNPPSISSGLREVFSAADCQQPTVKSANFWLIAHAISNFHSATGTLPLPGSLPDMKAQSSNYIQLQNIYKVKARDDLAAITSTIRQLEQELGRTIPVDDREIEAFCKNAAFVKIIHGKPLRFAKLQNPSMPPAQLDWIDAASCLSIAFYMSDESLLPVYLAFLAHDFATLAPASKTLVSTSISTSTDHAKSCLTSIMHAAGVDSDTDMTVLQTATINVLKEFERVDGNGELHNISALMGGIVAQEIIKVITKQYVPVDNACVFDGIGSRSAVFRM